MSSTLNNKNSLRSAANPDNIHDLEEARKLNIFFDKKSSLPNNGEDQSQPPDTPDSNSNAESNKTPRNKPSLAKKHLSKHAYTDRVQMDRLLARPEFRIKSYWQVLWSSLSFFRAPPDKVCKFFVINRLPQICNMLEQLVAEVRIIFPRSDHGRNVRLRTDSPFSYKVLNVIRHWNISRISAMVGFLQHHSDNVYISDLKHLIRLIYQPIFTLDAVDADEHFPFILNNLYRLLPLNYDRADSAEAWKKTIETMTHLYREVSREACYALYPLLMSMLCEKWCDYSTFLTDYRQEIYEFLELKEEGCIIPPKGIGNVFLSIDDLGAEDVNSETVVLTEENSNQKSEKQSLERVMQNGLETLDMLFPGAGWNQPTVFPDFYQYFVHVFHFKKGVDCLHPQNPVLQIFILEQILQDLFYGWHSMIKFSETGNEHPLVKLIIGWQQGFEKLIYHDYLKLLAEYYSYFSLAAEFRQKAYGRKITNEINYFMKNMILPFYDYSGSGNIDVPLSEYDNIFNKIEALYHELDKIAAMPDKTAYIGNSSAPFVFDVPNPVSKRLFSLFGAENRSNEILITLTHEITAVLHYLVNCPDSWAYTIDHHKKIFRSKSFTNMLPMEWRDQGLNPDDIFRHSIERLRLQAIQKFERTEPVTKHERVPEQASEKEV